MMGKFAEIAGNVALAAALAAGLTLVLSTCGTAPRMPAVDGAVIEIRRSDDGLARGGAGYGRTLQLSWFGSGCHLIRVGDMRVLTDPFVTNEFRLRGMRSDPERVAATLARVPVPDAVLVNHSHHDHILDGHAAMSLNSWRVAGVPMFGGSTCGHIMAGWGDAEIDTRFHALPDEGGAFTIRAGGKDVRITAYRSEHSPHLKCGLTFANGKVLKPRTTPPRNFRDFQSGECFNYLIEFPLGASSINVFYLGTPCDLERRPDSLPRDGRPIDVAIILAPSADNIRGYPEEHLALLKPRHVVLSHFNSFMEEDPDAQLSIAGVDVVKMPKLTRDVQAVFAGRMADYPGFQKLHIPAITVMESDGSARNVLRIR